MNFKRLSAMHSETCLNEVRPRRPEQCGDDGGGGGATPPVSMKSGLEGRNNWRASILNRLVQDGLNEVRPRRPEQ